MSEAVEKDIPANLAWVIADGSRTAHVLTTPLIFPRRGERGWRSGPRALCKRYPLRNGDGEWFSFPIGEAAEQALRSFAAPRCGDCCRVVADLTARAAQPADRAGDAGAGT